MKAIVCPQYGSPEVLQIKEVEKPAPKNNEILVRIFSTAVTSGDARIRGLNVPYGFKTITRLMFGFSKPKKPILGVSFAGLVESVGETVTQFKVGDEVFGASNNFGCHAEYVTVAEKEAISIKPSNISFDEAAASIFGGLTSLKFLRDFGKIEKGQKVLVNGASGSLGVFAIQLAKYFGAEVTGICGTSNLELVKSLGADTVIDYTSTDFAKNGESYDIIYDTVGKISFSHAKGALNKKGRLILPVAGISQFFETLTTSIIGGKKVVAGVAVFVKRDLEVIKEFLEKEKIKSVIGKRFSLEHAVEAHAYVDTGHKVGSAVISIVD